VANEPANEAANEVGCEEAGCGPPRAIEDRDYRAIEDRILVLSGTRMARNPNPVRDLSAL